MDAAVRERVRHRAGNRCEYCLLKQEHLPFSPFQVEHIIPRKHGGDDDPSNLALACDRCNAHKGPNLTGIDPETGEIVPLFNPREHAWAAHFRLSDATIVGPDGHWSHYRACPEYERRTSCASTCGAQAIWAVLKEKTR